METVKELTVSRCMLVGHGIITDVHTQARKAVAVDVLQGCDVGGDGFTSPLFTAGLYLGPPF
jgi:hypothetical protein